MASISTWLRNFGIDPKRTLAAPGNLRRYLSTRKEFTELNGDDFLMGTSLPMIHEWNETSGSLGGYFYQDQLLARWIYEAKPLRHVDIGSRLDGFIGSLSVFREVDVIDIRPEPAKVQNVRFHQLDLMAEIPDAWIACTDSLSCLHTIEHFGLGRYGDPIDPAGHLKGIAQLKKMVAPGGIIYLSTQIGPQRVEFNAHRVFSPESMLGWFGEGWQIERSAVIDDRTQVTEGTGVEVLKSFRGNLGVGIVAARRVR